MWRQDLGSSQFLLYLIGVGRTISRGMEGLTYTKITGILSHGGQLFHLIQSTIVVGLAVL